MGETAYGSWVSDIDKYHTSLTNGFSVATDVHIFPGLPHGFRRAGKAVKDSERWDQVMEQGITWALSRPTPTYKFDIKTKQ